MVLADRTLVTRKRATPIDVDRSQGRKRYDLHFEDVRLGAGEQQLCYCIEGLEIPVRLMQMGPCRNRLLPCLAKVLSKPLRSCMGKVASWVNEVGWQGSRQSCRLNSLHKITVSPHQSSPPFASNCLNDRPYSYPGCH
jgi:hypothetical protein